MIRGTTRLIAHFGFPIEPVKAPMIYNPYFEHHGIDAAVVPMGVEAHDFAAVIRAVFRLTNIVGALVTMPHKVTTAGLLDHASEAVRLAGSCNAVKRREDGSLTGDMFDGAGFVLGLKRKGFACEGARCLVVGAGGVGSAICAALAGDSVASLSIFDIDDTVASSLRRRIQERYPTLDVRPGSGDPTGYDLVVNATPLGMRPDDPLPLDAARLAPSTFVGEVVMKQEVTPLLRAARGIGCRTQIGTDMLFEQIPLYLKFFGLRDAQPEELRALARLA